MAYVSMKSGLMYRRGYDFILNRKTQSFADNLKNCGEIDGQGVR